MSTPVVTITEKTKNIEIARLLAAHHIKRAPVVRDGQLIGIVSRADLLRALAARVDNHSKLGPIAAPINKIAYEVQSQSDRGGNQGLSLHGLLIENSVTLPRQTGRAATCEFK